MPEDKILFFSRTLFDSLFNLKSYPKNGSISVVDILAYYQKEFLNDNFKEIHDVLAKDLKEVLNAV
ncbi:12745_t:CDS:1, partial [Funneliformis caledonium]